ncbi:damage-control phosphatase ARMT1 family protein [Baaleninema simplex]|uniref:damage-control phosphatase ARMT1 family protein n=1 Tax=Baaleninema simplex TaxID=2862350 RepID=UPI00034BC907|nr:ARMT1-like domain-containing protein [Baaleninema simplex]
MKLHPECVPCLFQQALRTAKLATDDETQHWQILNGLVQVFTELPENTIQVEVAGEIQQLLTQTTGDRDPYRHLKQHYNDIALKLTPHLREAIATAEDSLLTAIRIAIAGNIVDFGISDTFDLEKTVFESLTQDFEIFDYEEFKQQLKNAKTILYISDNTGEIAFDRLLIEQLLQQQKQVTLAVRGAPAINDATLEDAAYVGLTDLVPVITTGTALPGTVVKKASEEFQNFFKTADLAISKGQGKGLRKTR